MPSYNDLGFPDDSGGDAGLESTPDWLESASDTLADAADTDLGDSGVLRPWKTSDI
jgi:hypothetical protein